MRPANPQVRYVAFISFIVVIAVSGWLLYFLWRDYKRTKGDGSTIKTVEVSEN